MIGHRTSPFPRTLFVVALLSLAGAGRAAELLDLAVNDVVARAGDPIELVAKLEKKAPRGTNVPRVVIEFRLDGARIGTGTTDDRGFARLKTTAPAAGDHQVKAVFDGTKELQRAEYNALCVVRATADPILVLDVDWTLAMTDDLNTNAGGVDCPPIAGAPEAVTALAKKYTVVYVTSRARQLRKRTISWLFRYGFPRGASFYMDPKDYPTYDVVAYKTAVLKELAAAFTGMKTGIGNDSEDIASYKAAGLRAIAVGKQPVPDAEMVPAWPDVEKALAGH